MRDTVVKGLLLSLLLGMQSLSVAQPVDNSGGSSLEGLTDAFSHRLPLASPRGSRNIDYLVGQQSSFPLAGLGGELARSTQTQKAAPGPVTDRSENRPVRTVASIADDSFSDSGANCSDMDLDGVCDNRDHCQNTPRGSVVMPHGCRLTLGAPLELVGVFFDFNGHRLRPESEVILDRVAALLKQKDGFTVEVAGHTDSKGSPKVNQRLSKQRAKAVYDYLIAQGIAPYRLSYKGYGDQLPISANLAEGRDSPAGRARNRRVELRVTGSLAARD